MHTYTSRTQIYINNIMAFTRFNYDDCRTKKRLQEATGPGRYALNMPGTGPTPCFFNGTLQEKLNN